MDRGAVPRAARAGPRNRAPSETSRRAPSFPCTMDRREAASDLAAIARRAIEAHLSGASPPAPPRIGRRAAVFVTIRKDGELRGCIGTMQPQREDLGLEVAERAVAAARDDPRFPQVTREEWPRCQLEISVLGPLDEVMSTRQLDPSVFGIEVTDREGRTGVLLPDLPGVDTAHDQIAIARRKGGIGPGMPVRIRRFRVERHEEPADSVRHAQS